MLHESLTLLDWIEIIIVIGFTLFGVIHYMYHDYKDHNGYKNKY